MERQTWDMRKNDLQKRFKRRLKLRFKVQGKGDKDKDGKEKRVLKKANREV